MTLQAPKTGIYRTALFLVLSALATAIAVVVLYALKQGLDATVRDDRHYVRLKKSIEIAHQEVDHRPLADQRGTIDGGFDDLLESRLDRHAIGPNEWLNDQEREECQLWSRGQSEAGARCEALEQAHGAWAQSIIETSRAAGKSDGRVARQAYLYEFVPGKGAGEGARLSLARSRALHHAMWLTVFRVRRLVIRGDFETALDVCIDALAFRRAVIPGTGLVGQMLAVGRLPSLMPPCVAAADRAPGQAKKRWLSALDELAATLPSIARSIREDEARDELKAFASTLPAAYQTALAPYLSQVVPHDFKDATTSQRDELSQAWAARIEQVERAIALFGKVPAVRDPGLQRLTGDAKASNNRLISGLAWDWAQTAAMLERDANRMAALRLVTDLDMAPCDGTLPDAGRWRLTRDDQHRITLDAPDAGAFEILTVSPDACASAR